jgi:transcriptional regulator with XRE-family HTH domain
VKTCAIIKKIREEKGIKQTEIALFLNLSQSNYSKLENGTRALKEIDLVNIANFLKIPVSAFSPNAVNEIENKNLQEQLQLMSQDITNKIQIIQNLLEENIKLKLENELLKNSKLNPPPRKF